MVTIKQVLNWGPCSIYDRERVTKLFAGREALSARDIVGLPIPYRDKLWALSHPEFLTRKQARALAHDFAERVLPLCGDDPRPAAALAAHRAWLRNDIPSRGLLDTRNKLLMSTRNATVSTAQKAIDAVKEAVWPGSDHLALRYTAISVAGVAYEAGWDAATADWEAALREPGHLAYHHAMDSSTTPAYDPGLEVAMEAIKTSDEAWDAAWEWQLARVLEVIEAK